MSCWNLSSFPADVLADVTKWLYSEDILAMYLSGDRFLQAKMTSGGVTELHHFSDNAEVPSIASFFDPHLVKFSIKGAHLLFAIEFTENTFLKLPKSITDLEIDGDIRGLDVGAYLPNLRRLKVSDLILENDRGVSSPFTANLTELILHLCSATDSILKPLSRTLNSLSLVPRPSHRLANSYLASEEEDAWPELRSLQCRLVTPADLPRFPRHLTRLHLESGLYEPNNYSLALRSPWSLLPPGIIDFLYGINTIEMRSSDAANLNRSMTRLSLAAMTYVGFDVETIENLPRSLRMLNLKNNALYALRFDAAMLAALPPTLCELHASFFTCLVSRDTLPPSLTNLGFGSFCPGPINTLPSSLTSISHLRSNISPSELPAFFGEHTAKLTVLHLELTGVAANTEVPTLPETITDVKLLTPAGWIANLNCLPRKLRKLEMRLRTVSAFPPGDWFSQLPNDKLESLKIPVTKFTRQQVSYLHLCKELKTLLLAVDFYGTDLLDLLPKKIENLDIACIVSESWRSIREKLPPMLRALNIRLNATDNVLPSPGADFGPLPHRLREFEVYY